MRKRNVPISEPIISEKSRKFAFLPRNYDFKARNGWLIFVNVTELFLYLLQEKKSLLQLRLHYPGNSGKIEKYFPDVVYNADETGLFYHLMPDKSVSFKDSCKCGKESMQRLSILLCLNSTETDKEAFCH